MPDLVTAKQLREERAPLVKLIQDLNDAAQAEKRDFNAEERVKWETINKDIDHLKLRIDMAERAEKLVMEINSPIEEQHETRRIPGREDYDGRQTQEEQVRRINQPSEEDRCVALQAWLRRQYEMDLEPHHVKACERVGLNPAKREIGVALRRDYDNVRRENRNLSINLGATGGFTRPEGFVNALERALLMFGGMRQVADVMRTASGNDMPWPTINATSNKGRIIGENTTDSTTLEPTFGQVIFRSYKYTSDFIKVPIELLEDSAFQLAATLGDLQGEAIGRIQNDHFSTGTGISQPTGLITACVNASATVTAGTASAIAFDDLIGLVHSVDPAYRNGAGIMMHDLIVRSIRKLKDGQGRYLWEQSTQLGEPDRILSYPLTVNQSMDSTMTTGKNMVAFGQFSKYKIRDAGDLRMRQLKERFADSDQEGFIGFLRSDGNLLNAGVAPVKVLVGA